MTALLEQAVAQARQLPEDKQDAIAALLLRTLKEFEPRTPGDGEKPGRKAGSAKGMIWMSPDFDAPLEDFKEYT